MAQLLMNPKTQKYFQDPEFIKKIGEIQKNPSALGKYMQDP